MAAGGILLLAGCANPETPAPPPSRTDPAVLEARQKSFEKRRLDPVTAPEPAPTVGEVPAAVIDKVRVHLAERTGSDVDQIDVVRAQWQQWPDGAMGCPQPDMLYTQNAVEGYWIVLRRNERDYDYRLSSKGALVLCEGRMLVNPPVS
jgi:hypothetical protein